MLLPVQLCGRDWSSRGLLIFGSFKSRLAVSSPSSCRPSSQRRSPLLVHLHLPLVSSRFLCFRPSSVCPCLGTLCCSSPLFCGALFCCLQLLLLVACSEIDLAHAAAGSIALLRCTCICIHANPSPISLLRNCAAARPLLSIFCICVLLLSVCVCGCAALHLLLMSAAVICCCNLSFACYLAAACIHHQILPVPAGCCYLNPNCPVMSYPSKSLSIQVQLLTFSSSKLCVPTS